MSSYPPLYFYFHRRQECLNGTPQQAFLSLSPSPSLFPSLLLSRFSNSNRSIFNNRSINHRCSNSIIINPKCSTSSHSINSNRSINHRCSTYKYSRSSSSMPSLHLLLNAVCQPAPLLLCLLPTTVKHRDTGRCKDKDKRRGTDRCRRRCHYKHRVRGTELVAVDFPQCP